MYPFKIQLLADGEGRVCSRAMQWKAMRAHYERLFRAAKERGETQETIAARVGLRQNNISRLFDIEELGPQVETFIKAIEGLGMPASTFFAQIEGTGKSSLQTEKPLEQDASLLSLEAPGDAAPEIDRLAERFARTLVQHVERGLAESDQSAPTSRPAKQARRKRVRRRRP